MTTVNVQFVKKSANAKIGRIPCTTSGRDTCPPTCPLINNGCYASSGFHTRLNWDKVTSGERGGSLAQLCETVAALPDGQLWRHNVAGDLPHKDGFIDYAAVKALADANKGKRGFTYTHHLMTRHINRDAVEAANMKGFTINLSGDNIHKADKLAALNIAPVVAIVAPDQLTNFTSAAGNKVVICPAVTRDDVTCETCKMCAIPTRKTIIAFPAHGTGKAKITNLEID